jgi:aminoglycoside/choline kinase family phosphotransferase
MSTVAPLSSSAAEPIPDRSEKRSRFLAANGWGAADGAPLADDCSYRRYFRLDRGDRRMVLMDAPPDAGEDVRPFVTVARRLRTWGLSAPGIGAVDSANGFLLLEDMGDTTYTRALADGGDEAALYTLAIDALIAIQKHGEADVRGEIPDFSEAVMQEGAGRFLDWYLARGHGLVLPEDARAAYADAWARTLPIAKAGPMVLVHRDYHVDNLMVLDGRPGAMACGLLDFQDAMIGPMAYDVMSLLQDARRDVAPNLIDPLRRRHLEAFEGIIDPEAFETAYRVLGAQRSLRILGVFARQSVLLGNHRYLVHVPRLWRYIDENLAHPALAPVRDWFAAHVPDLVREIPPPGGRSGALEGSGAA